MIFHIECQTRATVPPAARLTVYKPHLWERGQDYVITTLHFCILFSLVFVCNVLEHLLDIADKEAPLAPIFQGEGATCSVP